MTLGDAMLFVVGMAILWQLMDIKDAINHQTNWMTETESEEESE